MVPIYHPRGGRAIARQVRWCWLAVLCFGRVTEAAAPTAHLLYVREAGAQSCPDESSMRAQVAARLGREPFVEHALTTVSVTLYAKARELRARIELVDASGDV